MDVKLALKLAKYVHDRCKDAPHDIGMGLEEIVRKHQSQLKPQEGESNLFSDDKFIGNVCLSYRHDFGLMSEDEKDKLIFECKEWMRAIKNNANSSPLKQ